MGFVVDTDSYVYEPTELWDKWVPAESRSMARSAFFHEVDDRGNTLTVLNGAPAKSLNRRKLVRQAIWRPGMTPDQIGQLDPNVFQPLNPGAWDPVARLADMDAMGIDVQVVFPTLLAEYLPQVVDPNAAAVLARAYNDWIWDFAQRANGRIHPAAILPMQSVLLADRELERVAEMGFRSVVIRPAFYKLDVGAEELFNGLMSRAMRTMQGGGSWGDHEPVFVEDMPFRPLWARISELGLTACVVPSLGITGPDAVSNGGFAERVAGRVGVHHTVAEPIAAMQDACLFVTAALFHGLLEDLPELRLAILHSGVTWVPLALEKSETYLWLTPFGGNGVCLEPEEVWDRHPLVVGFDSWERPVGRMPDLLGPKAVWGSRYPQHDASGPDEARAMLGGFGVEQAMVDGLLGGHAAELFGLPVPAGV